MRSWFDAQKDARLILVLIVFIVMQFFYNAFAMTGWYNAPSEMDVHHIPGLQNIYTTKAGETPRPTIYSFGQSVWMIFNTWEEGKKGYTDNLNAYRYYFTPKFYQELKEREKVLNAEGELKDRKRVLKPKLGKIFSEDDVLPFPAGDAWSLTMDMQMTETNKGVTIKDVIMRYQLRIVPYAIAKSKNIYGFAIDGFMEEPTRLETLY